LNGEEACLENNIAQEVNSGGGIYVDDGVFIMNGGVIRNNTAQRNNSAGAVFILNAGNTCRMISGVIEGNKALADDSGGAIYIDMGGTFEMYSGTIKRNEAQGVNSGGGLYNAGVFYMSAEAAVIESNVAQEANSGGGVYDCGSLKMNSGVIKNNVAEGKQSGGGLYINEPSFYSYNSISGSIKGNKALWSSGTDADSGSGGAVYTNGGYTQIYSTIGGTKPEDANTALVGANGVYIVNGELYFSGIITGNTAMNTNNYGVYVKSSAFRAFSMLYDAKVTHDNKVFLYPGVTINIESGSITGPSPVANIICDNPINNVTKILRGDSTNAINKTKDLFWYDDLPMIITPNQEGGNHYGYYNGVVSP
jgi:hypothetical protein